MPDTRADTPSSSDPEGATRSPASKQAASSGSNYSPSSSPNTSSLDYKTTSPLPSEEEFLDIISGNRDLPQRPPSSSKTPLPMNQRIIPGSPGPESPSPSDDEDNPSIGAAYSRDLADFARSIPGPSNINNGRSNSSSLATQSPGDAPKRTRRKTYCFYCEEEVHHFARHVARHHANEIDVQRILSLKKQSKERKRLLYALRTKGNYLLSKQTGQIKPVRTPERRRENTQPLPCRYCYGFFARKHLWRHMRACPCKPGTTSRSSRLSRLNLAQNMTLSQVNGNAYLQTNVFPRMHADEVTKSVKADSLICAFGARFAQIHQERHQVNVISRKMRELGKLLIQLNTDSPQHEPLIDLLRPQNFERIVEAVKHIAKYDCLRRQYGSPTYAMNIATSIKECCEIACNFIRRQGVFSSKAEQETAELPFRNLVDIITSDWKYEIAHNAHNDLARTSMNKLTIVPLARDLRKLKEYLIEAGDEAYKQLEADPNNDVAFKNLVESVYCRVMLLCRKRCGELARLPLDLYLRSEERQSYEEFTDVLTPAEVILARRFRRLLILGKRRPTAVLFSETIQHQISLILKLRPNFVRNSNEYLFATGRGIGTLIGYRVITKLANKAGLDRPEAITTRALRKHLATVCQVLDMNEQDIEQLATFMGHTGGIHRSEYRLPDSIFQTAKVSKLLMMMESGEAAKYKGKSLDEIDFDLEEDLLLTDPGTTIHDLADTDATESQQPLSQLVGRSSSRRTTLSSVASTSSSAHVPDQSTMDQSLSSPRSASPSFDGVLTSTPRRTGKQTQMHVKWTADQKKAVKTFFARHIQQRKAPKRFECEQLISEQECLRAKAWTKIKVFVVNEYNKKKIG